MKLSFDTGRRSATVKVALIALLVLVLLIPTGMIKSVVYDRTQVESSAAMNIQNSWGGEQVISGPILKLPFKLEKTTVYGSNYIEDRYAFLVAKSLASKAVAKVETRYRGIHKIPVYAATIEAQANFDLDMLDELSIDYATVDWSGAEVLMGVSDAQAINEFPVLMSTDISSNFTTTSQQITGLPPQLIASVGNQITARPNPENFSVQLLLSVNGTGSLQFLPLAENAVVRASANWPSPSFAGRRLPASREITDSGFKASWQVTSLGRSLPAQWIGDKTTMNVNDDGVFGVRFMQPIGIYQLIIRALKYAVMFVGLTFVTYFLMEIVSDARLHPLQYLLVGLSNTLFYLLLLSLAEHIGFRSAYIVSAGASSALIVAYSMTVLTRRSNAAVMGAVLAGLYGFLYLTLTAENYALLAGSVGLWFILAVVMFLTRKIDWYRAGCD